MTEILRAFWKEKRPERIAVLVSGILFAVIFWIYEIPVEIAGYAFLLVILWNVIWFTLVFIRYEKRQRILEENQGKIRTEAGGFPEAESRESEMYQELIRQLYEEKKELESSVQIEKQELSFQAKRKTQAIFYDSRLTSLTIFYFYQLPARLITGIPYT